MMGAVGNSTPCLHGTTWELVHEAKTCASTANCSVKEQKRLERQKIHGDTLAVYVT